MTEPNVTEQILREQLEKAQAALAAERAANCKMRETIRRNDEWHKTYSDCDGYEESELGELNCAALATPQSCPHEQRVAELEQLADNEHSNFYMVEHANKMANEHIEELEKRVAELATALVRAIKALKFADEPESRTYYFRELVEQLGDPAAILAQHDATVAAEARRKGIEEAASMLESTNSHHVAIRMIRAFAQKGGE